MAPSDCLRACVHVCNRLPPHWRRNVTFHLFDLVSWFYWFPSQKPLTIWTWDFHVFHFFFLLKKISSEKRVLHYTYSEGTPLPARQNKALQALFFITYPRSRFFLFFRRLFRSCSASTPPHWGPKTIKRDLRQSFFLECLKSRVGILRQKDKNWNPTRWVRFLFILCYLWGIESARRFPWKLSFRLLFSGRFALAVFAFTDG